MGLFQYVREIIKLFFPKKFPTFKVIKLPFYIFLRGPSNEEKDIQVVMTFQATSIKEAKVKIGKHLLQIEQEVRGEHLEETISNYEILDIHGLSLEDYKINPSSVLIKLFDYYAENSWDILTGPYMLLKSKTKITNVCSFPAGDLWQKEEFDPFV